MTFQKQFTEDSMVKIVCNVEVKYWVHWKKMFDEHSVPRNASLIKTISFWNELDNPNKVHFVLDTSAADTMQKFMQDPENSKIIEQSGHKQESTVMAVCSD